MCQYQAIEGRMQDWHYQHHSRFASGGLALGFVEATGVTRDGRITHGCTGIWEDSQVPALKRIADLYHQYGAACGIQIGHAGRRASAERPWDGAAPIQRHDGPEPAWQRVGPSEVPEREGYPTPRALTESEIDDLVEAFVAAAKRALTAGFDVLEIHGAHGYLIHSFFSPISNRRTDAFGGTRDKRMRFPLLVAEAVRAAWPVDKAAILPDLVGRRHRGRRHGRGHGRAGAGIEGARHRPVRLLVRRHVGTGDPVVGQDHARLPGALCRRRTPAGGSADDGGRRDPGAAAGRRHPRRRRCRPDRDRPPAHRRATPALSLCPRSGPARP